MTTGVELFPQTLPAGTVVGNPRSQAGPAAAIPFAKFAEEIAGDFEASAITFTAAGTGAVTRTVQAELRERIKPQQFGATGDGVTDDTAALAAWLVAIVGKAGYAPPGTYLTSSEMAFNVGTSGAIMIEGAGPETIFKATGVSNKVLHIIGVSGTTGDPVVLRNFAIQSATSGTSAAGLHMDGLAHWLIEGLWIDGKSKMTNGIKLTASQQGQISGGMIKSCATGGLVEADGSSIRSNGGDWHGMTFMNNTNQNLLISSGGGGGCDDIFFHGNHLTTSLMGLDISGGTGLLSFTDNHIEPSGASNDGVIVRQGRIHFIGNTVSSNAGRTDLNITGGQESKIIGNLFSANVTIGAGATSIMFLCNSTGGTCTNSGTGTISFGNFSFSGSPFLASTGPIALARTAPVYGGAISIFCFLGNEFDITATNNNIFTVSNPQFAPDGMRITITIRNASGGALGAVTWDTLYKLAAWTSPANGFSRSIDFKYNMTNWIEVGRTTVDVPN